MLLFAGMPAGRPPWNVEGSIPIFRDAVSGGQGDTNEGGARDIGGFVLDADEFGDAPEGPWPKVLDGGVLCAYPFDPHTFRFVCTPPGISETCLPACCCGPASMHAGVLSTHTYYQSAYPLAELPSMLEDFVARRPERGYNEVIVSMARWEQRLPNALSAFFYPNTAACAADNGCERRTREAHARFLSKYPSSGTPLLTFDPTSWDAPFGIAGPESRRT